MEMRISNITGIPEGSLVSIRVGSTRRQATMGSEKPYKFDDISGKQQMKVDVYALVAQARLLIDPCDAKICLPLVAPCARGDDEKAPAATLFPGGAGNVEVNLDVNIPSQDKPLTSESEVVSDAEKADLRPQSAMSERSNMSSASRRHQVALEAQPYFEEHAVVEIMQTLLQGILKDKPVDPYAYMVTVLQNSSIAAAGKIRKTGPVARQIPVESTTSLARPQSAVGARGNSKDRPPRPRSSSKRPQSANSLAPVPEAGTITAGLAPDGDAKAALECLPDEYLDVSPLEPPTPVETGSDVPELARGSLEEELAPVVTEVEEPAPVDPASATPAAAVDEAPIPVPPAASTEKPVDEQSAVTATVEVEVALPIKGQSEAAGPESEMLPVSPTSVPRAAEALVARSAMNELSAGLFSSLEGDANADTARTVKAKAQEPASGDNPKQRLAKSLLASKRTGELDKICTDMEESKAAKAATEAAEAVPPAPVEAAEPAQRGAEKPAEQLAEPSVVAKNCIRDALIAKAAAGDLEHLLQACAEFGPAATQEPTSSDVHASPTKSNTGELQPSDVEQLRRFLRDGLSQAAATGNLADLLEKVMQTPEVPAVATAAAGTRTEAIYQDESGSSPAKDSAKRALMGGLRSGELEKFVESKEAADSPVQAEIERDEIDCLRQRLRDSLSSAALAGNLGDLLVQAEGLVEKEIVVDDVVPPKTEQPAPPADAPPSLEPCVPAALVQTFATQKPEPEVPAASSAPVASLLKQEASSEASCQIVAEASSAASCVIVPTAPREMASAERPAAIEASPEPTPESSPEAGAPAAVAAETAPRHIEHAFELSMRHNAFQTLAKAHEDGSLKTMLQDKMGADAVHPSGEATVAVTKANSYDLEHPSGKANDMVKEAAEAAVAKVASPENAKLKLIAPPAGTPPVASEVSLTRAEAKETKLDPVPPVAKEQSSGRTTLVEVKHLRDEQEAQKSKMEQMEIMFAKLIAENESLREVMRSQLGASLK